MMVNFKVRCKCGNKFVPTQFQRYYSCPKCGRSIDTGSVNMDVCCAGAIGEG